MPREIPSAMEMIGRPDQNIRSHSTLELFIVTGAEDKTYHFATGQVVIDGVTWQPQLRETTEIRNSIKRATNRGTVDLQNVDTVLGVELARLKDYLTGADAKMGRYWENPDTGQIEHEVLLTGVIAGLEVNERVAGLVIAADTHSGTSVGPIRKVRKLCQARYKGPECGYRGAEARCDYTLNGSGGCHGRHGNPLKFAKHLGAPYLDNAAEFRRAS